MSLVNLIIFERMFRPFIRAILWPARLCFKFIYHYFKFLAKNPVALITGIVSSLGFAPFNQVIFAIAGHAFFYHTLQHSKTKAESIAHSYAFGIGFFVGSLYWLGHIFIEHSHHFPIVTAILFIFILANYGAATITLADQITLTTAKHYVTRLLLFALCRTLADYHRSYLLTGLPWGINGYQLVNTQYIMQTASVVGVYGLGFIMLTASGLIACVHLKRKPNITSIACGITLLLIPSIYGYIRLTYSSTDYHRSVNLIMAQANIPINIYHTQKNIYKIIENHAQLSAVYPPDPQSRNLIIWGETAVPLVSTFTNQKFFQYLTNHINKNDILIFGTIRKDNQKNMHNSLLAVNTQGAVVGYYDKQHLVPFGEFAPLKLSSRLINKLFPGMVHYSAGSNSPSIQLSKNIPQLTASICYESLFPTLQTPDSSSEWMLNITNDTWLHTATGAKQNLNINIMRAVETGMPMVRVANSGISAVIDSYGRIIGMTSHNTQATLRSKLPKKIPDGTTYSRISNNNYISKVVFFVTFILLLNYVLKTNIFLRGK